MERTPKNPVPTLRIEVGYNDFYKRFPRVFLKQLGYGVIATSSPWIATKYSFNGQPSPFEQSVFPKSFQGVLGAGRGVAASCRGKRGDQGLVRPHQKHKGGDQYFF